MKLKKHYKTPNVVTMKGSSAMFDIIMKDILGQPAILVGLFAMCGLLLQKKNFADTVSGTLKQLWASSF